VRDMVRKGKDFEKLISIIEKGLANTDIKIKSPDYLKDNITGKDREVDLTLRKKIDNEEIIIIFECRDRKITSDVIWIEQLVTKVRDLNAFKVIAVSSSGFTDGAKKKAEYYDIELRTTEEITNEQLMNWIIPSGLFVIKQNHNIINCTIVIKDPSLIKEPIHFHPDLKVFIHPQGGIFSANDLYNKIPNIDKYIPDEEKTKEKMEVELKLDLRKNNFSIINNSKLVAIEGVILKVIIWDEKKYFSVKKMGIYSDNEKRIAGFSEFPIEIEGKQFKLITHTYKNEKSQTIKSTLVPNNKMNK